MKNLILILVLAVLAFSTLTSTTPANWRRSVAFRAAVIPTSKLPLTPLTKRQDATCEFGYFQCPGSGTPVCCPDGSNCIGNDQCSVQCNPEDTVLCGPGCCLSNQICTETIDNKFVCEEAFGKDPAYL